jgi:UDP-2,4-diacetamido-2,4,6-trideoxy-beta-L-altropyranose hydrolase
MAVFRADASPTIGGGHIMRCLALADALTLAGWHCEFAVSDETVSFVPVLGRSIHSICPADWERPGTNLLVIDHYGLGAPYETAARAWASRVLVIDDLADRQHDCDCLLDPSLGRLATDYAGRVPSGASLCIGPAYALLRPEFAALRAEALARRETPRKRLVEKILVGFGAVDGKRMTPVALEAIALAGINANVDVVLGAQAQSRSEVERLLPGLPYSVCIQQNVDDMATLMLRADLAIGASGTTSLERCCLGLPSVAIVTAENQRLLAHTLVSTGAQVVVGEWTDVRAERIATMLSAIASDKKQLTTMAHRAAAVCDGRGVNRLLKVLVN